MRILSKNSYNCSLILVLVSVCEVCLFSPKSLKANASVTQRQLSPKVRLHHSWEYLITTINCFVGVFLSKVQVYKK